METGIMDTILACEAYTTALRASPAPSTLGKSIALSISIPGLWLFLRPSYRHRRVPSMNFLKHNQEYMSCSSGRRWSMTILLLSILPLW